MITLVIVLAVVCVSLGIVLVNAAIKAFKEGQ